MNNTSILDNLQAILETAEMLASVLPDEAIDDNFLQESIDNALGELERSASYLKDKYDIDISSNNELDADDYLSNDEIDNEFSGDDLEFDNDFEDE